jgi:predicted RNA-binding Zn-ribbon protein involved in translation (DUF1610 family)
MSDKRSKPKMCIYCKQNHATIIEKLWDWLCPLCGKCWQKWLYEGDSDE